MTGFSEAGMSHFRDMCGLAGFGAHREIMELLMGHRGAELLRQREGRSMFSSSHRVLLGLTRGGHMRSQERIYAKDHGDRDLFDMPIWQGANLVLLNHLVFLPSQHPLHQSWFWLIGVSALL